MAVFYTCINTKNPEGCPAGADVMDFYTGNSGGIILPVLFHEVKGKQKAAPGRSSFS
jgi:hypothetical protein